MSTRVSITARSNIEKPSETVTILALAQALDLKKLKEFLGANPNVSIEKIKDVRLYTLLHISCLNNQLEMSRLLLNHTRASGMSREEIRTWVNLKTDEGFTALHFASFKGNITLIKLLEEYEADIYAKNSKGLSVLHIAAQGDQPTSMAYFLEKGLDLSEKDYNGSTTLHWAAYFGMENATNYLTAWGCSPNAVDNEFGCTPLHLAVNSGNFKVVKRLLTKGADKRIKNKEGKLPVDLAIENDYQGIVELLRVKKRFLEYIGVKSSLDKSRSRALVSFFVIYYLVTAVSTVLFLYPYVSQGLWILINSILLVLTVISFLFVWLKNPGYVNNKQRGRIFLLLSHNVPHLICPECVIVKPERSKHCEICKSCVSVYDHHCPWVDNCIGARNYAYFVVFIITILITLISLTVLAGFHVGDDMDASELKFDMKIVMISSSTMFILKEITCTLIIIVAIVFIIPLIGLNYLHFVNLLTGKTTNERLGFASERKGVDSRSRSQSHNRSQSMLSFDQTSPITKRNTGLSQYFRNCASMCCKNSKNDKYNSVQLDVF